MKSSYPIIRNQNKRIEMNRFMKGIRKYQRIQINPKNKEIRNNKPIHRI